MFGLNRTGPAHPYAAGPADAGNTLLPLQFRPSGPEKRTRDAEKSEILSAFRI